MKFISRSKLSPRSYGALFIVLFALDSLARTTIVPLQDYSILGDAQTVSALNFAVSVMGLTGSMTVPSLIHRISHHRTMILGSCCMMLSAVRLSQLKLIFLVPGLALQMFGGATIIICLNLCVLRTISRQDFTRFEPVRIMFAGGAWVIGPALGVFLENHVAIWVPYVAAAAISLLQLGFVVSMQMGQQQSDPSVETRRPNPFRFIRRFFRQPRLVLAWILSVARTGWWGLFYIFGPIYLVSSGLSAETCGIISSLGAAGMLTVIFWGWIGRRIGLRKLLMLAYGLAGALTLLVSATAGFPWVAAALLIAAAACTSIIDSCGNVPFLRSVRPRERS
jgi:MFS family permease